MTVLRPKIYLWCVEFALVLSLQTASAQSPTFSLEVATVNAVPLSRGPAQHVITAPGDVLIVQVYIRDWSVHGEKIRAYQAELDDLSYSSGDAGTIQPVGLTAYRLAGKDNTDNAFIEVDHPQYIHINRVCIQLTDTRNAPGYRWLSVVIDSSQAPVSPQDGTKFYGGTVKMKVSEDARGVFTLGFIEDPGATNMMDENSAQILPVHYESLTVEVREDYARLRIVSSNPPHGAIDARGPFSGKHNTRRSWNTLTLTFHSDVKDIHTHDFVITDGSDNPPRIRNLTSHGSSVSLKLDRSIRCGAWTQLEFKPTGRQISFASLPGDVNNDGHRSIEDISVIEDVLNGVLSLPGYRTDIDHSGTTGSQDMVGLIHLLSPTLHRKIPARLKK